jgi:hypothetical protein
MSWKNSGSERWRRNAVGTNLRGNGSRELEGIYISSSTVTHTILPLGPKITLTVESQTFSYLSGSAGLTAKLAAMSLVYERHSHPQL